MKTNFALAAALAVALSSAHGQITVADPTYGISTFYTHTNSDTIVSFDVGANGGLFYQTATPSFTFGGLYQYQGGVTTTAVPGSAAQFSGASVISVGQSIYYNTSDSTFTSHIYQYGPVNGAPTLQNASSTPNYGLYTNSGRMFITGAPSGTNHIYLQPLNGPGGGLVNADPAVDLGADSGASGPLAFDAAGDLFYAPGFGDLSIYRWSKADVDAAIANPTANPLTATGHKWLDYSSTYGALDGGTSMLVDANGNLLVTLTDFNNSSVLAKFGVGTNGAYNGSTDTVLSDNGLLGELRLENGALLLSAGNEILQVVPEPSAVALLALGGVGLWWRRRAA